MDLLFVYGTLRSGGSNDIARLVPAARLIGKARMRGVLYDLGAYPALVADAAAGWVAGEVYAVPEEGWGALDALEDVAGPAHPDGEYFRVAATVEIDGLGARDCQVYVANPAVMRLDRAVAGGDWIAHARGR